MVSGDLLVVSGVNDGVVDSIEKSDTGEEGGEQRRVTQERREGRGGGRVVER